ncbi:MAG TPA: hypothetical protein VIJ14_08275, partial [Rhabdochlamydiaceae bacterium]
KILPEERFIQVDYYVDHDNIYKVKSITTPLSEDKTSVVQFSYEPGCTEVYGPGDRKIFYRFRDDLQLIAIEQFLDGSPYRVYRKSWGERSDAGSLISTSVEDGNGNIFYYKHFVYDRQNRGTIVEEREYGDIAGTGSIPLTIDEDGIADQEGHIKYNSYFSGKTTHGFFQRDAKGSGVKYWYKKGTNLLVKKCVLTNGSPDTEEEGSNSGVRQLHFYTYNEDAVLTRATVEDKLYSSHEKRITEISPKLAIPNIGAPEIVEQKYGESRGKREVLLKRTVNQFDGQGNIVTQSVYDANGEYRYSIAKGYDNGLLVLETDPLGNETHYSYDLNHNLLSEAHSETGISIEYDYDLRNRCIRTIEKDRTGKQFETGASYDVSGNRIAEMDRFGNETLYIHDSLGRPVSITYPKINDEVYSTLRPTFRYTYDLFDNQTSVTDPKGRVLAKSYTVHGKPAEIRYLDGTQEIFRYDSGGSLYQHHGRDGLVQIYKYDFMGRVVDIEFYDKGSSYMFKNEGCFYSGFHKASETDGMGRRTSYTYDQAGRVALIEKENQKVEFIYDSLGRTHGVKKWTSSHTFTLEVKEYDLLDRVVEERIEDTAGRVLLRSRYIYNEAGQLAQVVGYPQNKESILWLYEYDGFGRLRKAVNAAGHETQISYDDAYVNDWGQKGQKRTVINPIGCQIEEVFDNSGNLVKFTEKDTSGALLSCEESSYDVFGRKVLEKAHIIAPGLLLRPYAIEHFFGERDQLASVTLGKGTSEERRTYFEYNSYGELTAKFNPGSPDPIAYEYSKGYLSAVSFKEGRKEETYKIYRDRNQNIFSVVLEGKGSLDYTYDYNDLPLSEEIRDEHGCYKVNRTYDGAGNIETLRFPDGSYVKYTYEGPFVKSISRFNKDEEEL